MSDNITPTDLVFLTDEAGHGYLISREVAEASMIPDDKKEAVRTAISADVRGYDLSLIQAFNSWRAISSPGTYGADTDSPYYKKAADVNGDGMIDGADKAEILEAIAGFKGTKVDYSTKLGTDLFKQ